MRITCRHCGAKQDIPDREVLSAHAAIVARRRKRDGTALTAEQARAMQLRSAEARSKNAQARREAED